MTDRANWTPPLYEFKVGDRVKLRPGMVPFYRSDGRIRVWSSVDGPALGWRFRRDLMRITRSNERYGVGLCFVYGQNSVYGWTMDPACLMLADPDEHRARLEGK